MVHTNRVRARRPSLASHKSQPPVMIRCQASRNEHQCQPLVMIQCTHCEFPAYSLVESAESEALFYGGLISRHCHYCGARTLWKQFNSSPARTVLVGASGASCHPVAG